MLRIRLMSPKEQTDFVRICSGFSQDITLHKGHLEIDAKSLMGVMSVDCRFDCYITIGTDSPEVIEELETALSKYSYE
jgi:phosphotransferase system HPr (HPr) family protein